MEETWSQVVFLVAGKTFFALLLLFSGVSKLLQPTNTERMIYSLHRRFRHTFRIWARAVATGELLIAALLLSPAASVVTLAITVIQFLVFDVALVRLRLRGFYESCGCFGSLDASRIGSLHCARNAILTLSAAYLLYLSWAEVQNTSSIPAAGYLAGVSAFLFAAAIYRQLVRSRRTPISLDPSIHSRG